MTSYLRNIFGEQPTANHSKSHLHPRPTPRNRDLSYIYALPGIPSSSFSPPILERGYPTYESGSVQAQSQGIRPQQLGRAPLYRNASDMAGEHPFPYPFYTPSMSLSGSYSASNLSIFPGSSTSDHPIPPTRTSSSGSVVYAASNVRPAFKQSHTWHAGPSNGYQPHGFFGNPQRPPTLQMHPLLAYSPLHHAPIFYDISYTPSSRTVLDRGTFNSVPAHTLSQPATEPPTISRLVLKSDKFPWPVVVTSSSSSTKTQPGARFYVGGPSSCGNKQSANTPVTNLDILYALHNMLAIRVTHKEWEALGHGSRVQRKVTRAYEKRCVKMGGGWDSGVRRIDWLGGETRLFGVDVDKIAVGDGICKLIFGKA